MAEILSSVREVRVESSLRSSYKMRRWKVRKSDAIIYIY